MDRRGFIRIGTGITAGAVVGITADAGAETADQTAGPFLHGVASGDPLPDGLVLWTRVTPSSDAIPGSRKGAATEVNWEVAVDDEFTRVVAHGQVMTDPAQDHTVKVAARGLEPDVEYRYRFSALGQTSPTGRGITAPATDAEVERLRFGMVSCSNYPAGYFSAYRHLAARDDLDAIIHLGDYIYESGSEGDIGRVPDPPVETVTLEDYRRRHALYKSDPDLQALHSRYAFITTIDDHELTNDAYATGAESHQSATEGDYVERRRAAFQAYSEWMPIRADVHGRVGEPGDFKIQRTLRFGNLAEIVLLDLRTFRDRPPDGLTGSIVVTGPEPRDPARTILGDEQKRWLFDTLDASTTTWRLIGNSVMFAPLVIADLPDAGGAADLLLEAIATAGIGLPAVANGDQWDGYQAEQAAVAQAYAKAGNVVVLTGDIHSSWANEIPADPGSYLPAVGGESAAVEFVTPAVTSNGFSAIVSSVGVPGLELLGPQLGTVVPAIAPWIKYLDADRQGFGIFEVTAEKTQYDWHHLAERTDPDSTESFTTAWATRSGTNRLTVADELGERSARPQPTPAPAPSPAAPTTVTPPGGTLPATGGGVALPLGIAAALGSIAVARRRLNEDGSDRV